MSILGAIFFVIYLLSPIWLWFLIALIAKDIPIHTTYKPQADSAGEGR